MPYLLDTNILVRLVIQTDPQHELVTEAVAALEAQGETFYAAFQNMAELWNVLTRPPSARGGYNLALPRADELTRRLESIVLLLTENEAAYQEWRRLVVLPGVSGVQVHDARLAALMRVHGISHILTLNATDFARYGVTAVHPSAVVLPPDTEGATT